MPEAIFWVGVVTGAVGAVVGVGTFICAIVWAVNEKPLS